MPKVKPLPVDSREERLADAWLEEAGKVADRIAAEEGTPSGASKVSERRAVMDWGLRDPKVDHAGLVEMLQTTGVPQEMIGYLMISETSPDLVPAYLEPVADPALAEQLATLAEYPMRAPTILDYSDDDEERCQYAEHLARLWEQEQAAVAEQMARMPVLPPLTAPQMPGQPPAPQIGG